MGNINYCANYSKHPELYVDAFSNPWSINEINRSEWNESWDEIFNHINTPWTPFLLSFRLERLS